MSRTLAEKLLASHGLVDGRELPPEEARLVRAGRILEVSVDRVLANDVTAPIAIREFGKLGVATVFDREAIVLVADHFTPNKDIASAEQCAVVRRFAEEQGLANFYDVGRNGIEHVLLPERGLIQPGAVVVGADSHTCTYGALGAFATGMGSTDIAVAMATGTAWMRVPETVRAEFSGTAQRWVGGKDLILWLIGKIGVDGARYQAIEFGGSAIDAMPMSGRFTMANMAIEAGAKVGLFAVDSVTRADLAHSLGAGELSYEGYRSDPDAAVDKRLTVDVGTLEPQVALPHSPANVRPIGDVDPVPIDQVVIGSCTNGRLDDLRTAARVLRGRKVARGVRCIVIPGSQQVMLEAVREGLIETFLEADAAVSPPTCGPCLGGHMGILARGERAVATTNRNFRGRMGHSESEVYLAGPAVAAASAVVGHLAGPEEVLS